MKDSTTKQTTLPDTLAQRVQILREKLGITSKALAQRANLDPQLIEDIESGIELFLSTTMRSKLARALKVTPWVLQTVEKQPDFTGKTQQQFQQQQQELLATIAHHPHQAVVCPLCQSELVIRRFSRQDLEGAYWIELKVHCSQCLFAGHQTFPG